MDVIICNDHQGCPVPVDKAFPDVNFGLLTRPPNSNIWVALVIANRNSFLKSGQPTGHYSSKLRELNTLGFYAAIVDWKIYIKLDGTIEKSKYLDHVIKEAICNKN
ncbi:uncharacterized protein LOC112055967 isoform X2 [Bicyclus anynana]|uniref:Uncharacterized protein LOC112055967 isoform X2 n=1 Tax=Bicyclus anynana TaxID=110368 RepID=A0ABM3LGJ6_BICAN|nr:uncharacterized protein LOC112055967 isoform X2 [Bicyclus anynana]